MNDFKKPECIREAGIHKANLTIEQFNVTRFKYKHVSQECF